MKRPLKLILALVVLVALIGGYFLVTELTKEETPAASGGNSTLDTPFLSLEGTILKIDYTYAGEQISLAKGADGWQYAADPSFPLSADALSTIETVLKNIEILRTILPEETDPELFGLTDPQLTVSVLTDAGSVRYVVGLYNKSFNGYYLQKDGDPMTYLVAAEMPAALSNGLYAIAEVDAYPQIMSTNATALSIRMDGAVRELSFIEGGSDATYADAIEWFDTTDGGMIPARETAVTVLAAEVTGLTYGSCIDYAVSESEWASYGFDAPYLEVELDYYYYTGATLDKPEIATFTLTVGNTAGEGERYLTWSGTKMAYTVAESALEAIIAGLTDDLTPFEVCAVSVDSIRSAKVSVGDKSTEIGREVKEVSTIDAVTGETVTELTEVYTVDGEMSSDASLAAFFETLTTMQREATADPSAMSDEVYMTVVLSRSTDAFAELTVTFYVHDANFCRVAVGDSADALVSVRTVEALAAVIPE